MRSISLKISLVLILLYPVFPVTGNPPAFGQDTGSNGVNEFFPDYLPEPGDDGLPWHESIVASHYGSSMSSGWGGYGNRIYPQTELFCALPANHDNLDCLGGVLGCRESRCGTAQPTLDELLNGTVPDSTRSVSDFEFWPGDSPALGDQYGWILEGEEGDGYFRVIEIKPAGVDQPIIEAYVGDVGPWCIDDPYWEDYSRPNAEDGVDTRGRRTNRAGIDCSWALAQALGFTGLMEIDWRWKTVDGAYVVRRQPTDWRW